MATSCKSTTSTTLWSPPLSELTSVGSAYRTIEVFSAENKRLFTLTLFSGVLDPDSDELLPQVRV